MTLGSNTYPECVEAHLRFLPTQLAPTRLFFNSKEFEEAGEPNNSEYSPAVCSRVDASLYFPFAAGGPLRDAWVKGVKASREVHPSGTRKNTGLPERQHLFLLHLLPAVA